MVKKSDSLPKISHPTKAIGKQMVKDEISTKQVWDATQQILEAVNLFSDHVENRFSLVDKRFNEVDKRFDEVDKRFDVIEQDVSSIKNVMVTKDYLDEKMADLHGDLIATMHKGNNKLIALVDKLEKKKVISIKDSKTIMMMEPFAKE